jgi:hypothetical protein
MTMAYPLATWRNEFSCRLRIQVAAADPEANVILSEAEVLYANDIILSAAKDFNVMFNRFFIFGS